MKYCSPPSEMIEAFENRVPPFNKDVVLQDVVRQWWTKLIGADHSPKRITLWLTGPPFMGVSRKFCTGPHGRQTWHRAIILRHNPKWENATGSAVMDHINGKAEPLTEAGKAILAHIHGEDEPRDPLCE